MSFRQSIRVLAGAALLGLAGAAVTPARAASPPPTMVTKSMTAVATVESVDPTTRQVLLSGPGGRFLTVTAGPDVRRFSDIHAGDHLVLTFHKAVAVQMAGPDKVLPPPAGVAGAMRSARGELPAGAGFTAIKVQVRVDAMDRRSHTVTFTDPDGVSHTAELRDPALIRFANKLKPGDQVQIDYLEGVSITLHPMAS